MMSNGSSIMLETQTQKTTVSDLLGRYTPVPPMRIARFFSQKKVGLCVLLILLVHLAVRLWGYSGIHDMDELAYSEAASRLLAGQYIDTNPYSLRYMVIVPLALTQMLFGINEYACAVTPMIYSLVCLGLIYLVGKTYVSQKVGLLAAALWAIFPLDVIQATELHLDVPMTAFHALCVYALVRGEQSSGPGRWVLFTLAGVALGLAHLAKEVGLVLLVFLTIRAIWKRAWHSEYLFALIGFFAVVGMETAWYGILTGDPLYRFSDSVWGHHRHVMHTGMDHSFMWMYEYAEMLADPLSSRAVYFGGFFLPVLAGTVWGWYVRDRAVMELSFWWMSILVVFNFAPLDQTFQQALFPHWPRTLHPIFMPGLVIVAHLIVQCLSSRPLIVTAFVCFLSVALLSVWLCRLENRQFAESARQTFVFAKSLPRGVTIVTDPLLVRQLRFYYRFQDGNVMDFPEATERPDSRPTLWVYDTFSLSWTMRYWGKPKGGAPPPPDCPMVQLSTDVVPAFARTLISVSSMIVRGADRVLRRWDREPVKLFVCVPEAWQAKEVQ